MKWLRRSLVLVLVGSGGITAVALARSQPVCVRYRCITLTADAQVSVFEARARHLGREAAFYSSFARWRATGRVSALGDRLFEFTRVRLNLSGRFVAAVLRGSSKEPPWSLFVTRLNAATGRRETVPAVATAENQFGEHAPGVTDICATAAGTVAWLVSPPAGEAKLWRVFELPPGSRTPVELAASPTLQRGSLACVAGHAYWLDNGVAGSAAIR